MTLIIDSNGALRFIYKDEFVGLLDEGNAEIKRASHVEPTENGWNADLSPVGGPMLGPYTLRQEALDAEVAWLEKHGTPVPG